MSFPGAHSFGADASGVQPRARASVRHSRRPVHGRFVLRGVATLLLFLMSFAGTGVGLGMARLQGNIEQHDIEDLLGDDRPSTEPPDPADPTAGQARNILILGSDTREGANAAIDGSGTSDGMRADTTILAHISADRTHVDAVSIPRDTLVDIPSCALPDGTRTAPQEGAMFNSAFSTGGQTGDVGAAAACTIRTVEQLTGVYIDDFAVVDFTGFINVVDALGGIAMYIEQDIDDSAADLRLEAGCRLLDGRQALGYARVRHIGDGSDLQRIDRQQAIVMEILQEALQSGLLGDPIRLYQVLDTATQTLTTSTGLGNITNLAGLGMSLQNLSTEAISLVTMPFDPAGNRVVESQLYSPYVWEALREDRPLDPAISGAGYLISQLGIPAWGETPLPTPSASATTPAAPSGAPSPSTEGAASPASTESEATPTDEATDTAPISPAPTEEAPDPALSCTKENAS